MANFHGDVDFPHHGSSWHMRARLSRFLKRPLSAIANLSMFLVYTESFNTQSGTEDISVRINAPPAKDGMTGRKKSSESRADRSYP